MRLLLIFVFPLICTLIPLSAQGIGIDQTSDLVVVGTDKFLRWYGHADRNYFVQVSDPNDHLKKWSWAPIIENGNNGDISYEVDGTAEKGFFRLKYTNAQPGPNQTLETADFDNDYLSNWAEITVYSTDPLNSDTDGDGLGDGYEIQYYRTNPNIVDSDGDGLGDGDEVLIYHTSPTSIDTDGDGIPDNIELNQTNTSPTSPDSDGDGVSDGDELAQGTNPNSATSYTFQWNRVTRSLQYDFDEYPPPNNKGALNKIAEWNAALNTNEMLTSAIPFPSLKARLEVLTFPTTPPATAGTDGLRPSEGNSELMPDPPCFHATLHHHRLWIRRNPAEPEAYTKTVVLITERTIDGAGQAKLIDSKNLIIPANDTVSDFIDVSEGLNQNFTGNTSHTESVKKTPVVVDIQRDEDVADGKWHPLAGKLAKALPGEKINLKIDTSKFPANVTVGNFEWILPPKVFKDFVADNSNGTLTAMAQADQTAADVHFYFADSGDKSITVKFKVDNTPIEATIQIKVEKPVSTFTTEKGTVRLTAGNIGQHALGYFGVNTQPYGVRFVGSVATPQAWSPGTWSWVQLIKTRREFTNPPNGNSTHIGDGVSWKLDKSYPYSGGFVADGQINRQIGDSPSEGADSLFRTTIRINDSFQTYLMFRPNGTDSRDVPMRKANWNWGGEATAADNWVAVSNPVGEADAQGAENNNHPQWTANTEEDVEN